jgi:hypothetical protein
MAVDLSHMRPPLDCALAAAVAGHHRFHRRVNRSWATRRVPSGDSAKRIAGYRVDPLQVLRSDRDYTRRASTGSTRLARHAGIQARRLSKIFVRDGTRIVPIALASIERVQGADDYATLVT